jgi:photosystem II stability/assembly factor-like uncharacterized protein
MDGGATWAQVYDPGGTNQLWAIDFNANGVGLASGATSTVLRTTDFGNTWTPITGFGSTSIIFYSVRFGSDTVAYLSGSNGYFYKSTDAGATWTELSYRFTTTSLKDVSFANDNVGYTVGTSYIAKTTNGGMAWTPQTSPYTGDINEVVAPSPNVAIAGCDGGYIIRTTNGGAQWQSVQTGITGTNSDILAIDFIDSNNGMVVAYNGTAAKTNDGGATWTMLAPITSGNPWDMDLIDTLNAYVACTGEKIYLTTDGGQSWSLQLSVGGLGTYGISALSKDVAVAGGTSGNTYYTTNGGATWNNAVTKPGYTVWGIKIKSPTLAYAACASGYIYRSTDSGMNWTLEPRVTINTFSDIDITARGDVFAVGSSGVVVKYRAQQSNCTDIHIRQGWNILSVPRAAANRAAAMLFPNKTSAAFGYDNGYIAFDTLQYGNGYWMRFANAETVNLCGNTTGLNTIPVQQGWNIIGGYDKAVPVSGVSTTPPGIITSSFFGFNNGYVSGDSLIPGKGYWIRVSQNGVLNLPSVASTAKSNPFVAATVPDGCPKIIFSDDEGFRRELYILNSNDRINLDAFVLPPLPPSGIADARFLQSTFAEYAGQGDISIAIQRGAGQLRMECENISLAIGTANNAERKYLHPGDRYSIPVESSLLTVTAVSQVPTEFSLMQNYPNPFNPVTTISYVLPRDGAVLLKVYDALGTEVAVLVNEAKRAGQYTLTWNAGSLPSGTYFYRLQAGEFTQTRKSILMK